MISQYVSEQFGKVIWGDFIRGFKSNTSTNMYKADVTEFLNLIKKDFLNISRSDVDVYYEFLTEKVNDGKIQPGTMAKKFRELHSVASFIEKHRTEYDVPDTFEDFFYPYLLRVAKVESFAKTVPTEHIDKLLVASKEDRMSFCMFTLIFRVGLSSTELIELKPEDFGEYDNGTFVFVSERDEWCHVPDDAAAIVIDYLEHRKENTYLFYNSRGSKMNTMFISRLMKKCCQKAGVPEYSAQTLRGACASTMFSCGASPSQVAKRIGVTTNQIKRYKNLTYKKELLGNAGKLVKIRVELPD